MNIIEKLIAGLIERTCKNYVTTIIGVLVILGATLGGLASAISTNLSFYGINVDSAILTAVAVIGGVALILAKDSGVPLPTKVGVVLLALGLALASSPAARAQTGISGSAGAGVLATHWQGNWSVVPQARETFDVKDSTAGPTGYVNSLYLLGEQQIGSSTAGFNYEGAGAEFVPTKWLAKLVSGTNLPADSLRVFVGGTMGVLQPNLGKNFFTGNAYAGASIALNQSGSIVWTTYQIGWMNPGIVQMSTAIAAVIGGSSSNPTAQSPVAAKLHRLALHLKAANQ